MNPILLRRVAVLLAPIAVAVVVFGGEPEPADLVCQVTSVHDGDSMRVRCPGDRKTIPVRLHQIDAPEIDQAHGLESRNYLRGICPVGSTVSIVQREKDQYDRTLGHVSCNGVDANRAMVESGSAWVYDHYVQDRSLYSLQEKARAQRRGLWSNGEALAPWKFRRQAKRSG